MCPTAEMLVWKAIAAKQSPLPIWLIVNTSGDLKKQSETSWIYTISLFKKWELKDGEYWERNHDGSKTLAYIHPETGEKWHTIIRDVPDEERVVLFEAEVDTASREVRFFKETVLANLSPDDFELFYEEPYCLPSGGLDQILVEASG